MKVDYHVHTYMCGHARGTIAELVESAIGKGFAQVGIADHMPLTYADNPSLSMGRDDLPRYVEEVLAAKERYAESISVRLGIEADYEPGTMDEIEGMIHAYPWDYVIGSVHVIDSWIFDDPTTMERYEGLDLDAFYLEYLGRVLEMVKSGLYNIVGHADLAKKFDVRASIDLEPSYREILTAVMDAGMCYEVNTAGLRWPVGEIYPEPAFVRLARDLGVPVTLGSDAHSPDDVGKDLDRAAELIRSAGYTRVATFEAGRMSLVHFE